MKDRTKNLLIFYFNGYCDLCNSLQNTFYTVGLTFRNEPDCVLARVNCDSNLQICRDQLIPYYPTLKIYTTRNKDGFTLEPGKLQESYSEQNLTRFMNVLCGTRRTMRGGLDEKVGHSFVPPWLGARVCTCLCTCVLCVYERARLCLRVCTSVYARACVSMYACVRTGACVSFRTRTCGYKCFARPVTVGGHFRNIRKWLASSIFVFCSFSREKNWHKLRKVY